MKKFFRELGEFASQRSVADVALGLIVGAALGDFVQVIVEEMVLPPISFITQGMNLENQAIVLREAGSIDGVIPLEDVAIGYGRMIEVTLEFVVIGLALFLVVRAARHFWYTPQSLLPDAENTTSSQEVLLQRTVELLEQQNALLSEQLQKGTQSE